MPSAEMYPRGYDAGEKSAEEIIKRIYKERGEKTELAAEREQLLARKKELLERREKIEKRLAAIRAAKVKLETPETADTPEGTTDGGGAPVEVVPETPSSDGGSAGEDTPTSEGTGEVDPGSDDAPAEGETGDAPESPSESTPEPADTDEIESADAESAERERIKEKAKKNRMLRRVLTAAAAVGLATTLALTNSPVGNFVRGLFGHKQADPNLGQKPVIEQQSDIDVDAIYDDVEARLGLETRAEAVSYAGELANGVHYDYNEYADTENKVSKNAFGYDKSSCFGDPDKTADSWMDMVNKGPEYLGAYAYYAFTDEEKAELGIAGMSANEIDNYLSDSANSDGGAKQREIMDALGRIAHDKENTSYEFYYENDTENSYYIVFQDKNNDGNYTPDELTLAYSEVKRNGAPQVDVYRIIDGQKVKILDLNILCGFQPNLEVPPKNIPRIVEQDNPTTSTIEEQGTPETTIIVDGGQSITEEETSEESEIKTGGGEAAEDSQEETPEESEVKTGGGVVVGSHPTKRKTPEKKETIAPKDAENLVRIDENIKQDIAEDIHTDEVKITPTEDVTKVEKVTPKPASEEYHEPAPEIVQNEASKEAKPVTVQGSGGSSGGSARSGRNSGSAGTISKENDYTKDRGGANAGNAAEKPVEANKPAQQKANETATPVEKAPTSSTEVRDILKDLGIN